MATNSSSRFPDISFSMLFCKVLPLMFLYSNIAATGHVKLYLKHTCHFSSNMKHLCLYIDDYVGTLSQVRDAPFTEDLNELGLISSQFLFTRLIEGLWRKQRTYRYISHIIAENIIFNVVTGDVHGSIYNNKDKMVRE